MVDISKQEAFKERKLLIYCVFFEFPSLSTYSTVVVLLHEISGRDLGLVL